MTREDNITAVPVPDRAVAVKRAKDGLAWLEKHPSTTVSTLGAARDQLNIVATFPYDHEVWDAVCAIEAMVGEIYGGRPD